MPVIVTTSSVVGGALTCLIEGGQGSGGQCLKRDQHVTSSLLLHSRRPLANTHTHAETFGGIEYQVLHFSESLRAGIEVSTPANAHKKCGILRFWTRKLLSDGKSRMKVECFPPLELN